MSAGIKAIGHYGLYVSDLEASRDFYVGVLGMREVPRPASFTFPGTWFASGRAEIHAVVELEPGRVREVARVRPQGRELSEGFWTHLSLEVEDVDAAMRAVEQRGVAVVGGPILRSDGVKQFYILDPDGNMLELWGRAGDSLSSTPG